MKTNHQITTVNIGKRQLTIKCPIEEVTGLHDAARILDKKVTDLSNNIQPASTEELVIVAALNIIQELAQQHLQLEDYIHNLNRRLHSMQNKTENTVTKQNELEL